MIHRISIQGYRSLRDFELRLSPRITVVQGLNGVGKSNLYKGLRLFSSLATAQFAEQIASEGGTSSCFWAGDDRKKGEMRVINLNLDAIEYRWKISFGLVPTTPGDPTFFRTDPDLKSETISTESTTLSRSMVHEGVKGSPTESLLTIIRGSDEYSEVSRVREDIASWRFYDNIRTDELSPAREPSARFWSPVLNQDASNLPSVIQTIRESGKKEDFNDLLTSAFPEYELEIVGESNSLSLLWHQPRLLRPLSAKELSDGTLKFIVLIAALYSPKEPPLIVLNEPENSLNKSLYESLARAIANCSLDSQILVITHSLELAQHIKEHSESDVIELAKDEDGSTKFKEDLGVRKVWRFD